MSIDRYDPIRVLGEGSFGKVYLMRDKVKRTFACVKIIKIKNIPKKEREATKVEVDLLRRLNHPNIVRYIDSFLSRNKESLCICMEYCDGGDLASQIKAARRNLFSESKVLHWFVQLALGLHYMHANKVLHRDLKTQNVFMLGNGRLVLGDLGISKVLDGTMDFAQTCIGTPYYMSPEIFRNKPYSYKSDVWALGCVLYEMTTLNHAFDANSLNGLATKIVKGKYPPIHAKYSRYLRELIGQMLQINPQQRPDLDQILRKPFIKKHVANFLTDINSRPAASIGEGTMIIRAAAGGEANGSVNNDSNMISLRQQLTQLGMTDVLSKAAAKPKQIQGNQVSDQEAIKIAREQAGALRREQEHKKMVEAALEKLRKEREDRAKQRLVGPGLGRPSGYPVNQGRYGAAGARGARNQPGRVNAGGIAAMEANHAGAPRGAHPHWRPRAHSNAPKGNADDGSSVASQQSRASEGARRRSFGEDRDNRNRAVDRERRAAEERRKQQQDSEAAARRQEDRRREEVRAEARAREEARMREEAKQREENAARAKVEQVRAQAEQAAKARREAQRDRERQRQRDEIEQLKKDKLELDRRAQAREEQRRAQLARASERKAQHDIDNAQEKMSHMGIGGSGSGGHRRADSKDSSPSGQFGGGEDISARDRVLLRRQEKQAKEEAERLEMLRAAERENQRIRQEAQSQHRNMYQDNNAVIPGASAIPPRRHQQEESYEFDRGRQKARAMDADELHERLNDAQQGSNKGRRFDSESPSARLAKDRDSFGSHHPDDSDDDREEDDDDGLWDGNREAPNEEEEEEDLARREEELRAELTFATTRVDELKRTLQETKSYLGPRLPTREAGPGGRGAAGKIGGHGGRDDKPVGVNNDGPRGYSNDFAENDEEDSEDYDLGEDDEEEDDSSWHQDQSQSGRESKLDNGDSTIRVVRQDSAMPRNNYEPSAPSPALGRLSDRIDRLRQRCTEALGREAFRDAYNFLKQHEEESQGYDNGRDMNDDDFETKKILRMRAILGEGKAHYGSLIEQLIFMEETQA